MTVGELLARVSSRELAEWAAYYALEPFGDARADLRAGIVASTVANTARDPKKRRQPFQPDEFMPQFRQQKQAQTVEEQQAIARQFAAAGLGRISKRKEPGL